jgi:energy-coupling factor transporter ATP-binding protein EcfA2
LEGFCRSYLSGVLAEYAWDYRIKYKDRKFMSIVCFHVSDQEIDILQLDFFNKFSWRGIEYIDLNSLQASIGFFKHFKVVSVGAELAITSIKEILGYGTLREKHLKRFRENFDAHKQVLLETVPFRYRPSINRLYSEWMLAGNDQYQAHLRNRLVVQFVGGNLIRHLGFCVFAGIKLIFRIRRQKNMIVFLGPDGSGKSTLIDNLCKVLDRFFPDNIVRYHRRYGFLPELKTNRGLASMKGVIKPGQYNNKIERSLISKLASWFTVCYSTLDYFFGNFLVEKHRFRGSLVMYDRYYYDNFMQPASRDLIFPLRKFLCIFVARPTVIVHLKASGQAIHNRKKDLSADEIDIQNFYIDRFLADFGNVIRFDSVINDQARLTRLVFLGVVDRLRRYK